MQSGVFARRHEAGRQKVLGKVVDDINSSIEDIVAENLSSIKITEEALDKGQYIAQRFEELTRHALNNGDTYEVSFFLIGDIIDGEQIITDFYIGHDQKVNPIHCNISGLGKIKSLKDVRDNLKKEYMGWAHSHGTNNNHFSHLDDTTFTSMFSDFQQNQPYKKSIEWGDSKLEYDGFSFMPSIVVNAKGDMPATRKIGSFPKLVLDDGEIKVTQQEIDTQGVGLEFVEGFDGPIFDPLTIDEELSERAYLPNGLNLNEINPTADRPEFTEYYKLSEIVKGKKTNVREIPQIVTTKKEPQPDPIIASLRRRGATQPVDNDLVNRIEQSESNYERLDADHTLLLNEYDALQSVYNTLKTEVEGLKSLQKPDYHRDMREYYGQLMKPKSESENRLGTIAKILSGDYKGDTTSITNGNSEENEKATRIWKWSDRIEAVKSVYSRFKDDFSAEGNIFNPMWDIIHKNRYASSKYKTQINDLIGLFSK